MNRRMVALAIVAGLVVVAAMVGGMGGRDIAVRQPPVASSGEHRPPLATPTPPRSSPPSSAPRNFAAQDEAPPSPPRTTPTSDIDPTAGTEMPGPAADGQLVVWARGDLTAAFAEAVGALPQVAAAAHVPSTTLGLVGSWSAGGTARDVIQEGFRVPVAVAAIDPSAYAATLPSAAPRDAVAALKPGMALLSETGARLRGIGVGGRIDLVGLAGLEVAAVVDDGTIGRAEIVVHAADAGTAGLDEDGTVYLRHEASPGAATDALIADIEELLPADQAARIVDVSAGEPRRRAPLVLSLPQVKERFGEFAYRPRAGVREIDVDPAFRTGRIVTADVPVLGSVTCHEDILGDLAAALQDIADAGLSGEIDPDRYAGCYYPRRISTAGQRLSHHSWGIAVDINVDLSHPDLGPPPHPDVIAAFERAGFRWGGDFLRPDNHHFEWVGSVGRRTDRTPGE